MKRFSRAELRVQAAGAHDLGEIGPHAAQEDVNPALLHADEESLEQLQANGIGIAHALQSQTQ